MGNDKVTPATIDVTAVREAVQRFMRESGASQNQVAKESGVGASTLSQFLSGEYSGRTDKVAVTLFRYLNRRRKGDEARALMPVAPQWVETPTAKKIWAGLSYAHNYADIALVYGGAGFGKTSTLKQYALVNGRVWTVTTTPATRSVAYLMEDLAMAVGFRNFRMSTARLQREIVAKISGTGGLLVIDEAQHLIKESLEQIRSIFDASGIGLVLSGNAEVFNRLYGGGSNGFAQLFSRVSYRVALKRPLPGDVKAIAGIYGVEDEDTLSLLEDVARKPGALRMVVKICRLATALSPEGIDRAAIMSAYEQLQADDIYGGTDREAA